MVDAVERAAIASILQYCGFDNADHRDLINVDGLESYADMLSLTEKDIGALAKGFAERTVAQGRIVFGLRRTNRLKAAINWAQDFRRVSREVTLDPAVTDMAEFRIQIETAKQRALIRDSSDEDGGLTKAADPGKLKRQKDWSPWLRGLRNYLSTIRGQDGIPLSYVIRENEEPDYTIEEEDDYDFEQLSINCAPLTGLIFKTDARKVHQLIHGFVQGETAEVWIKPKEKKKNGRIDLLALQAHYGGEGNKKVRIKEAEVLRTSLTYKNERAMSFEKFLTSMQAMFTGFADNEEVLTNAQKIRLLFDKVQNASLNQTKSALKIQSDLDIGGTAVTYDFIANSLAAEAAGLPEYAHNRQTSGMTSQGTKDSPPTIGIKKDGVIYTGYYPNWAAIPNDQKTLVYDERKRLGIGGDKNKSQTRRSKPSAVKTRKKNMTKLNREIASLRVKVDHLKKKRGISSDDDADDTDGPQDNAGDQFGGRKGKKKSKNE
jgi:hypothetical protein